MRRHLQTCVHAYTLVRVLEERLDQAGISASAPDALQQVESIHRVTIDLDGTRLERTSTPTPERADLLRALQADTPTTSA